jgi:hypothetical protein
VLLPDFNVPPVHTPGATSEDAGPLSITGARSAAAPPLPATMPTSLMPDAPPLPVGVALPPLPIGVALPPLPLLPLLPLLPPEPTGTVASLPPPAP